ncbi:pentatricopeptide repeat-containing protein At3g21470 isoform X2 [Eucalyptus grandis]|uniref:pentatricopeptide repeat-containing protein At3g21470 isoform X2 n=1 Tax=Eucalyptus grandis TaxID=71139 RepID=UPI00192EE5AD|nr:pentatricopeptide repeat-containing protein At3g21470 isoform X2 [Eucalyptus grandis]
MRPSLSRDSQEPSRGTAYPNSEEQRTHSSPVKNPRAQPNWSLLIRKYLEQGTPREAIHLYKQIRCNGGYGLGLVPLVAKACASLALLGPAKSLHAESIKFGSDRDVVVGTSLVGLYSKCGDISDARRMFDFMPERNVVTWNAMLGGYLRNGDTKSASCLFERMSARSHVTWIEMIDGFAKNGDTMTARRLFDQVPQEMRNVVTWTVMVDGYSSNGEMELAREMFEDMPERNFFVWSSMISGYCKRGDVKEAEAIFDRIPVKNLVNWNALISGYAQNGFSDKALQAFSGMQAEGLEPDEVTVVGALSACGQSGSLDVGKKIHDMITNKRINPNQFVLNALVDMYAKCGDLTKAKLIFDGIPEKNCACWNSMISGFAIHGQCKEALEFFTKMEDSGLEIFSKMDKCNILVRVKHYGCLVDLLGRTGRLEEAFKLIKGMPVEPNDAVWGALLGACRIHSNLEMAEDVLKDIRTLHHNKDSHDDSHYVLLSNIYAASDKWEKAERMRLVMGYKGVQKVPGCSSTMAACCESW